jgi:hypothetical protein
MLSSGFRIADEGGMSLRDRAAAVLTGGAWLFFGAVLYSLSHSPDAANKCHSDALWTGAWFFLPPMLAIGTLFAARRRVALIGSSVLLVLWFLILPLWFLLDNTPGGNCAG